MYRIVPTLVIASLTLVALAPPATAQERPIVAVEISDHHYHPRTIVVWPGTTVIWVNNGDQGHTVTSRNGLWNDSGVLAPGEEFQVTFDVPGIFYYYCRLHTREFMKGRVIVRNPRP